MQTPPPLLLIVHVNLLPRVRSCVMWSLPHAVCAFLPSNATPCSALLCSDGRYESEPGFGCGWWMVSFPPVPVPGSISVSVCPPADSGALTDSGSSSSSSSSSSSEGRSGGEAGVDAMAGGNSRGREREQQEQEQEQQGDHEGWGADGRWHIDGERQSTAAV